MRNIDMSYYRVYYYCNIIDNLLYLFLSGPDWAPTGAQFTEPYFDGEVENFSKYSALHSFCDFAVRQLLFEDAEKDIETIQACYDELDGEDKPIRLRKAFQSHEDHNDCLFEIDRLTKMYGIKHQSFFSYLLENDFKLILDAYDEFIAFDGDFGDAIERLTRELFYILFQNRDFLYRFNYYMAIANTVTIARCSIPQWVKRAVKHRDRGKCVCCGKDLSGFFDCEDEGAVHYDHMISLHSGGINDVSNIQLMCSKCNLSKSSDSFTCNTYRDWYDFGDS